MPSWGLLLGCTLCCCPNVYGSISDIETPLVVNDDVVMKDDQPINIDTDSSSDCCDDSKLLRALKSLRKQPDKSVLSPSNKTKKGGLYVVFNETLNVRAYKYHRIMDDIAAPVHDAVLDAVTGDIMNSQREIETQITRDKKVFYFQVAGISITASMGFILMGFAAWSHWHYQMHKL